MGLCGIFLLSVMPGGNRWKRTFEVGEDKRGVPGYLISGSGQHKTTACEGDFVPTVAYDLISSERAKRGSRSYESGVNTLTQHPCPTSSQKFTLRHYPTWSGNFSFPVLVMFWLYVDAPDWKSMTGERFSPLTAKGRLPEEKQIVTTHILPNGLMDIGHSSMCFQSRKVTVPLKQWNLQSIYLEDVNGETQVTLWSDQYIAAQGVCNVRWEPATLRHWHFGLYGDNNSVDDPDKYPNVPFKIFNDDIQVIEITGGYDEAVRLIADELEISTVERRAHCAGGQDPSRRISRPKGVRVIEKKP